MSEGLSLEDHGRGQALVAHAFREGLVVGAVVVHLEAELLHRCAVLAPLVGLMHAFALRFHLSEKMLKALVLELRRSVLQSKAIGAFFIGTVLALMLDFL